MTGIAKARQLSLYFQHYRELPDIKKEEVKADDVLYDFEHSRGMIEEYGRIDNSPDDYDSRKGHLLLAEEPSGLGPVQVSYQGDGNEARLSRLSLSEPDGGFAEEQYIFADEHFHALRVRVGRTTWWVEALHLDRMEPATALRQQISFKK